MTSFEPQSIKANNETERTPLVPLTWEHIAALNAARKVLDDLRGAWSYYGKTPGDSYALGRVAEAADRAEKEITNALITASTWGNVPLSDDELQNSAADDGE